MSDQPSFPSASLLLGRLQADLGPLVEKITRHPYLEMLEQKRATEASLKVLATQQYAIVTNGIRNIALIVARFGHLPSRRILNDFLQAEFVVHEAVRKFAHATGLNELDLQQAKILPGALMFSYFETFICLYASDADLITAFFFDAQVWISNARRVNRALQTNYNFRAEDVVFFDLYANYQPSEESVLAPLEAALSRGVPARQIEESARLLLEYELSFWDAMAQIAQLG